MSDNGPADKGPLFRFLSADAPTAREYMRLGGNAGVGADWRQSPFSETRHDPWPCAVGKLYSSAKFAIQHCAYQKGLSAKVERDVRMADGSGARAELRKGMALALKVAIEARERVEVACLQSCSAIRRHSGGDIRVLVVVVVVLFVLMAAEVHVFRSDQPSRNGARDGYLTTSLTSRSSTTGRWPRYT